MLESARSFFLRFFSPHEEREASLTRAECLVAGVVFALLAVLRVIGAWRYRVNSDEPQHLHVIWGWSRGLVQYRDVFDNHAPLFHLLYAPLFTLLGERADILAWMRLAEMPIFAGTLWCVYRIGLALGAPRRAATWAALIAGFLPTFFLNSLEFRPDTLWTLAWLGALAALVGGPFRARRAFVAGVLLGAAFSVSMKTTLLLGSLLLAGAVVFWFARGARQQPDARTVLAAFVAGGAGMAIFPCLIAAFFAWHGALGDLWYGVVGFNALPGGKWRHLGGRALRFPLAAPVLVAVAFAVFRTASAPAPGHRRALLLLAGGFYIALLRSYWDVNTQDYLPFLPLAVALVAPALLFLAARVLPARRALSRTLLPVALIAWELTALVIRTPPWRDDLTHFNQKLAAVLRLTDPGDLVMDGKGESIFRPRPIYWIYEGLTRKRIQMGLLRDELPARLLAARACVVKLGSLSKENRAWVKSHYVPVQGEIWVAGARWSRMKPDGVRRAEITIPADYRLVTQSGEAAAIVDGEPLVGARFLAAGPHEVRMKGSAGPGALVWAQAVERGFSPFAEDD